MLMNIIRTSALIGLSLLSVTIFGCSSIKIPAPEIPVKPIQEPVLENSTINVPVTVAMTSLTNTIDQLLSKSKKLSRFSKESNIQNILQGLLNNQASIVNTDLLNNVYVRIAIGKAWDALQSPLRLNYNLSLLVNPQTINVSPPAEQGDKATVVVGLVARPKLVSGDVPKISAQPLPNLSMATAPLESGFHLVMDNELSFDFIGTELTKKLEGKTFAVNGNTIAIKKIKIYGSGDSVIVGATVKGTANGTIYLTGAPAYDESSMTISIKNLDYTIETKNILVKTADWLLHSGLRDKLAGQATWFIGDKIDATRDMLSDALNRKLNQYVSISGKIQKIRAATVGITGASIKAVLIADGTVEVSLL